ncbi:hypothetical protein NW767_005391 [Fusarium falciforme]|uniref:(S)-ureidoglycine aminohydrolase cupin domain-containing protein n=1 Tax=Fusarium falciforme TaxID=195108 RepID=A0A9W8QY69_9HYPO|nr:hypothetical protein NW755_010601 [Fusarium falciforme]KAJ4203276.1 hypothetical protein NW767_005391 [Fusarium falciforme]
MSLTLQHFPKAQEAKLPFYGDYKNLYIGDTVSSTKDDPVAPLTSGFFRAEAGAKTTSTYTYFEVKLVVEGDLIVSDGTGQKVNAVAGDVLYFPKGATITFESKNGGAAFYVGQRAQKFE